MSAGSVCVLGSFMMDLVVRAPRRPLPGETLVGSSFETFLGGKGFNQAVATARAGAPTAMIGRLGADEYGAAFRACLEREGIDHGHVLVDALAGTGIGLPLVDDAGENSIVVVPQANLAVTPVDVERAASVIAAADVLLLQLELPPAAVVRAAGVAHGAGTLVVLNPAPAPFDLDPFGGTVDVLVANRGEAAQLAGGDGDPGSLAATLHARTGAAVVVTLGGDGAVICDQHGITVVAPHVVDAIDTVGAGDAFCGVLGASLAAGLPLTDAVVRANAAGALAVSCAGAEPSLPTAAAVDELLARTPASR